MSCFGAFWIRNSQPIIANTFIQFGIVITQAATQNKMGIKPPSNHAGSLAPGKESRKKEGLDSGSLGLQRVPKFHFGTRVPQ